MRLNRFMVVMIGLVVSIILASNLFAETKQAAGSRMPLTQKQKTHIVRFLFPLPQERQIGDAAFSFAPADCSIKVDPNLTDEEKVFVAAFRARWKERFGAELLSQKKGGLTIIVGKANAYAPLQEAETKGSINLKELASRPNAEQAYSISCVETSEGVTAYLAANKSSGLYYALGTFEQLLKGMEEGSKIIVPLVRIVDWPDIKERGMWNTRHYPWIYPPLDDSQFVRYAGMKLNRFYAPHLYESVSDNKKISYSYGREVFVPGRKNNVQYVPSIVHFNYMLMPQYGVAKYFPEVAGVSETGGRAKVWCWANPRSQEVLDQMFEAIARGVESDVLGVQPSEGDEACHCKVCNGDKRGQFVKEFKCIIHAYNRAKSIKPSLKMLICTTQGTHPNEMELLGYLPKEVGIYFYSSALTYQVDIHKPLLADYEVSKLQAKGHTLGVLPLLSASHMPGIMLFPFDTPLLVKVRMTEIKKARLESVMAWIPPCSAMDVNWQALAEYSWNADGRTPKEFAISWATRKGIGNPEVAGEIISMLDYPARALAEGMRADKMEYSVERTVSIILGKNPAWSSYFDMLHGFEYSTHMELKRVLKLCEEAVALSNKLGDKELISGSCLLKQWIAIAERYAFFLENKDSSTAKKVKDEVSHLASDLPGLWEKWISTQPSDDEHKNNVRSILMKTIMPEFERLKGN